MINMISDRISLNGIVQLDWTVNNLLEIQKNHTENCNGQLNLFDNRVNSFVNKLDIRCNTCEEIISLKTSPPKAEKDLSIAFYMGTVAAGESRCFKTVCEDGRRGD